LDQIKTTSERIDDLPLLIHWLKRMQVDVIIDDVLGPAHGNWAGLSSGEVALVFVAYVLMCCPRKSSTKNSRLHAKFVSSCTADTHAAVQLRLELTTFACTQILSMCLKV
jgi:hypothetical protein